MPDAMTLRPPTAERLAARIARAAGEQLGVTPGSTDGACPRGMTTNAASARVGDGDRDFAAARVAVLRLAMFDLPWIRAFAAQPVAVGTDVAVYGRVLGCWWTNVCRVTRVVDEPRGAGFVYATLRSHMMAGEERFAVELRPDGVWFELVSHSRPSHTLARLGWPLVRAMQRRFARHAIAAIAAAVARARGAA